MGMDLSGEGGYFRFNWEGWREVLELAYQYGWEPAGTELPEYSFYNQDGTVNLGRTRAYREDAKDWDGSYFGNEGQWVTEEDAARIADALERALTHIPDEETVGMQPALKTYDTGGGQSSAASIDVPNADWFSGDDKPYLRDFITYCRAGGFAIF
jgi:hypothetical protein